MKSCRPFEPEVLAKDFSPRPSRIARSHIPTWQQSKNHAQEAERTLRASRHFSRPVRNAHRVPIFVGVNRESYRPGKPHPKRLAAGDLFTNRRICEKVR